MKYFVAEYDGCPFENLILAEDADDAYYQAENELNGFIAYDPHEIYITPLNEWEALCGKWEDA